MPTPHPAALLMLLAALAMQPLAAQADSACWPEAKLIGTSATGFIEAFKLWALYPDGDKQPAPPDAVPHWGQDGKPGQPLRCEDIRTFNGGCHDDYAYVPLWGNPSTPRVQARSTRDEPIWLQVDPKADQRGRAVMTLGRRGELVNPDDAPLRAAHNPNAPPAKATPAREKALLAFMHQRDPKTPLPQLLALVRGGQRVDGWHRQVQVLAFAKLPDGLWMQLSETLAWSAEETAEPQPGPVLRTGWLRHRDANGTLLTVVQDDGYCD